ncbi:MAG: replication-relaxation family protein [Planctomycetota bacterium]
MSELTARDVELLNALAEYRALTCRQAGVILGRNPRALRRRLTQLVDRHLVETRPRRCGGRRGRPEQIYLLRELGGTLLGKSLPARPPGSLAAAVKDHQLPHQLLVNTFRAHLAHLRRNVEGLSMTFFSPDSPFVRRGLHGRPYVQDEVPGAEGKPVRFVPDGVLLLEHIAADRSLLLLLEADRGSEDHVRLTQKVVRYQSYFRSGGYRRYEADCSYRLQGFRLLLLTENPRQLPGVCEAVAAVPGTDFVWLAAASDLAAAGVGGRAWIRGGRANKPRESILGRLAPRHPVVPADLC